MTSVLKILESLDCEDGLEVSKLERSLKITRKIDKDNLNVAIKALTKLGIVQTIIDDKLTINNDIDFLRGRVRCSSNCLLYTSPSPRDLSTSRMPSSA